MSWRFLDHDESNPDPRPGDYYVSILDGPRKALVLGPFPTHAEALARVDQVWSFVLDHYASAGAPWWGYGTARMDPGTGPKGKLNEAFGL